MKYNYFRPRGMTLDIVYYIKGLIETKGELIFTSCSEKLPKEGQEVVILEEAFEGKNVFFATYNGNDFDIWYCECVCCWNKYSNEHNIRKLDSILWMPIPKLETSEVVEISSDKLTNIILGKE